MSSVKKCERPGPATNQPGNEGYAEIITNKMPQRQGDRLPWRHTQDYWSDKGDLPAADLDDGSLAYE